MVDNLFKGSFVSIVGFLLAIHLCASPAQSAVYNVVGWPLPDLTGDTPQIELGDDPVYGRQICPPLTRLNLEERKSEDLLIRNIKTESVGSSTVWSYDLRSGIHWWQGGGVTAEDLAKFIRGELAPVAAIRSGQLWEATDAEVTVSGPLTVKVKFRGKPPFGPYIFNGVPFFRPVSPDSQGGLKYECVGLYRPQSTQWGMTLAPTSGYRGQRAMPELALYGAGKAPGEKEPNTLYVRLAGALNSTPATRPPDSSATCSHTLELPNLLMIVWDKRSPLASRTEFRRAISQLMPRAALASAGAASLAEVAASPIPKNHPGFDAKLPLQGFDLKAASAALNQLGMRRASSVTPRLDERGEPIKLTLLTQSQQPGLAEKVIMDALSAVGITTDIKTKIAKGEVVDGVLANFTVDWPRVSYLPYFHSGVKLDWPVQPVTAPALDRELERYAISLTNNRPDWALLGAVQRRLDELEVATVLLQQKACIDNATNFKLAKGIISQRNPDWFRQLLF